MAAFVGAARTFALRFLIALLASFLALYAAFYAADRVAATKLKETTQLHFRPGSLLTGKADSAAQPANFLIVGSDTRGFVHSSVDVSHFGSASQDPGARSDTLMIAHIDPSNKQAELVSFPRDLLVTLPGGCEQKINAAYNQDFRCNSHSPYGGPQQIVDTLKNDFNIRINHYVEVNFPGFRQMVDVLGSVPIYFPAAARDIKTGLQVNGGCQNLTGIQSLNYVRSRYFQYYDYRTGRWVDDPTSDLGRIRRQQYFIRTFMQTAIDQSSDIFEAYNLAGKMTRSVAVDSNFSEDDFKRLIRTFRLTQPGAVQMLTVPTVESRTVVGALDLAPDADSVLSTLRSFAPPPAPPPTFAYTPPEVHIEVRNASGIPGAAVDARAESLLQQTGFSVASGPDAPLSPDTVLQYTAQSKGKVLVLFAHMAHTPKLQLVTKLPAGADLALVIGHAGSGLIDPNAPTPTTTTSTTSTPTTTAPGGGGGTTTTPTTSAPTTTTTLPPNPGTPPAGTPASSVKSQWIGCK